MASPSPTSSETWPSFYRMNVIAGPGAFVMTADDYHDFGEALRWKLIRELAPGPVAVAH